MTMIVNVEFFVENAIENVITSLNYKVDKTIFFGYADKMNDSQNCVDRFLKDTCGVQAVEFCTVDPLDLGAIMDVISEKIYEELNQGNQVFFDLTGGEDLVLVAFGILSNELKAPMHVFEVPTNQIHEYGYEGSSLLSETAEYDPITLNLDTYISLYGGKINYRMHKDYKNTWDGEEVKDIENMWKLSRRYSSKWVHYCALLRKFEPNADLMVLADVKQVQNAIDKIKTVGSVGAFSKFLDDCMNLGLLTEVVHRDGIFQYAYKNSNIKSCFWDSGSILEMYVFLKESQKESSNDCRVGVHIDWDGVIHKTGELDVLNEIDIMSTENNIPVFISCKIGNVDQMALYELETVAARFGGKHVKKVLAVAKDVSEAHVLRAKEMGIEIRKY